MSNQIYFFMKGIVFTELMEMVEAKCGDEVMDNVIEKADLPSGGAYTAVGSYPHSELVEVVSRLSEETGLSIDDLLMAYGEHLFGIFTKAYSSFFVNESSALDFLAKIESKIHPEVHKLYPDAELPTFEILHHSEEKLEMNYYSGRKMGKFAEGLIKGCLAYFNEKAIIETESLEDGRKVRFSIHK